MIVADEATSALDVSLRSQMLDLMMNLQDELGLAYVFISHDIGVIRYMCDRVAVMYRGGWSRPARPSRSATRPNHAYTKALLSAIPRPDPRAAPHPQAPPLHRPEPRPTSMQSMPR